MRGLGKNGEIGTAAVIGRTQGVGRARPDVHVPSADQMMFVRRAVAARRCLCIVYTPCSPPQSQRDATGMRGSLAETMAGHASARRTTRLTEHEVPSLIRLVEVAVSGAITRTVPEVSGADPVVRRSEHADF